MDKITVINYSGKVVSGLFDRFKLLVGQLNCVGNNRYVVTEGVNVIVLAEMVYDPESLDNRNNNVVATTPTNTLFVFENHGVIVDGNDVFCVDRENIDCYHNTKMDLCCLKNYLLNDYQIVKPKAIDGSAEAIYQHFRK